MTEILVRTRRAARFLGRLRADTSGNVAVVLALMGVVLMIAIGAAVDIGRWLHARDQTVAAIDSALLAGGRYLQVNGSDKDGAVAAARKYYEQNVVTRLPVVNDSVDFKVKDDGMGITASGTAYIKTPFLEFANLGELPLISTATTEFGESRIAVGGNNDGTIEIALMLDVTGSMDGSKLGALKDALIGPTRDCNNAPSALICIVFNSSQNSNVRISVVPFSEDIRLPSTALDKARGSGLTNCKQLKNGTASACSGSQPNGTSRYNLSPCVVERKGGQKYTDAAPGANNYVMANYTTNGSCVLPTTAELMPLTNDKSALINKVKGLTAAGGTGGHLGTAWAWYTLSTNWNTLWSASNQAGVASENLKKYAILMTDGEYNTQYDTNGVKTGLANAGSAVNGTSTTQARQLCTNMKAAGIVVYTVGFEVGQTGTAADTLKQCATDSTKYYNADDAEELKQAYMDIALKLSSLFISK